ncbi:hypothetical protein [Streptococcus halichoeri]|uniref:hypothetical protein n=1 Tax=Streptococcus halichoeri TaxID=254785 RepID=UPI000DB76788|nr:hypothetical protein [Streptococcus halichoeri]PZO95925.1 MAG: hypothetical protein DI617_02420 [Streptococcus pyogenes]
MAIGVIVIHILLFTFLIYTLFRGSFLTKEKVDFYYLVYFNQTSTLIDIRRNQALARYVTVISGNSQAGTFSVYSQLSDAKLKELLMKEYHLTLSQVIVEAAS